MCSRGNYKTGLWVNLKDMLVNCVGLHIRSKRINILVLKLDFFFFLPEHMVFNLVSESEYKRILLMTCMNSFSF